MQNPLIITVKRLLCMMLLIGTIISCQDEKPLIVIPEPAPELPQKEFKYVESLTPDTVKFKKFNECDSIILNIRTIPYDLLRRDTITVQITDSTGAIYQYADIKSYTLRSDSVWNIKTYINKGVRSGDIISLMVDARDTVMYSDPVVLFLVPKIPRALETITPDTLVFDQCDTAVIAIKTLPLNLLDMDSVKLCVTDSIGNVLEYADITSKNLNDSVWNIVTHIRYPIKNGDVILLRVSDEDTVMFTKPMIISILTEPEPDIIRYSIRLISDSIAGYLHGAYAMVSVKTTPWNILFDDTTFVLSLHDANGNSLEGKFTLAEKTFVPYDSCWKIQLNVVDKKINSQDARIRITCPDTVVNTKVVTLKKVTLSMSYVRTGNNLSMKYDNKNASYSYCDPIGTDFSARKFLFSHTGDMITIGDSVLLNNEYNVIDARKPFVVSIWKYGAHRDYTIKIYNTGLPVVKIDTNGKSVTRRDTWVTDLNMCIILPDGTIDFNDTLSIKGRGNGTWTETNKKPYALRLNKKAKILGMHKQKRWILLANYKDRTLLRNDAAFWLSRHTDLPYTVNGQFVELVWNGKHMGNYYLCEQARIDDHRIDIHNPDLNNPENGGIFMEIDAFLDYSSSDRADKGKELGFWSTGANKRYKLPYIFKDPDEDENGNLLTKNSPTYTYMFNYVKNMEDAIYAASSTNHKWMDYLDMGKAIDYALIQEITMNHDSYNTWPKAGPHSGFLYKDAGDTSKICFGPIWDFDYHTFTLYSDGGGGENSRLKQWEILKMDNKGGNKYYFSDLVAKDPVFKDSLVAHWDRYKYVWKQGLPAYIDQMAEYIRLSESSNQEIWESVNTNNNIKQNGDWNLGFQGAVNAMKEAFLKRWQWIEDNIRNL